MTNQTHISYSCAKLLKERVPGLPEPIPVFQGQWAWIDDIPPRMYEIVHAEGWGMGVFGKKSYWAYELHDLLSKPFCEAVADVLVLPLKLPRRTIYDSDDVYAEISDSNWDGGLPAVEAELCRMVKGE